MPSSAVPTALYLALACIVSLFPFAAGTATCSGAKLRPDDYLTTARDKVIGDLMANTFYQSNKQYCTYHSATGPTGEASTMYGMANCVMSSNSCGGNYCSSTFQQCWNCLSTARDRLMKGCRKRVAGYAVVLGQEKEFQCSMQFRNTQLCS